MIFLYAAISFSILEFIIHNFRVTDLDLCRQELKLVFLESVLKEFLIRHFLLARAGPLIRTDPTLELTLVRVHVVRHLVPRGGTLVGGDPRSPIKVRCCRKSVWCGWLLCCGMQMRFVCSCVMWR